MDEVTYIKNKFRQEQWKKLPTDCQSSGLKVDEWCEENHISRHDAPGMGDSLAVKVRYGLGSGNH